jgi:hypothetical protein
VHSSIKTTPAVELGVTHHIWSIEELIEAAERPDELPEHVAPFTLIPGGLS